MSEYPMQVETAYEKVLGIVRFPPGALAAWLDDEADPGSDLIDLEAFFLDLLEYRRQTVAAVLAAAQKRGLAVSIGGSQVLLAGNPGEAPFARDAIPLLAAAIKAGTHGAEGEVFFLGTTIDEDADLVVVLKAGKGADVQRVGPDHPPPSLPIEPAALARVLGGRFGQDDVVPVLQAIGYDVSRVEDGG